MGAGTVLAVEQSALGFGLALEPSAVTGLPLRAGPGDGAGPPGGSCMDKRG
ncbi:hypothetical protein JBE04_19010 [Streptomyces sp. PRKS01-29]|nr:hypothetical protein [Streptomyces sabulosicollis]MBI0296496.1 hypothetical protein [Streptomyces sabulosicollis]